jgi:signal peptidase I
MTDTKQPMHGRWAGLLTSLLIPGSGVFLGGDRKKGLVWFLAITGVWILWIMFGPLPTIRGVFAFFGLMLLLATMSIWMLFCSLKRIPRLRFGGWLVLIVVTLALSEGKVLLTHCFSWPFSIPTRSMQPTLQPGDHLLVQTSAYWFKSIERGQVLAFRTDLLQADLLNSFRIPKGEIYLKRVVGLPGETLRIQEGCLLVNGHALEKMPGFINGDFVLAGGFLGTSNQDYVVPPNTLFVIGDNHNNSLDSRYFGAIPRNSVIGRATKIYWPLRRAGDIQ